MKISAWLGLLAVATGCQAARPPANVTVDPEPKKNAPALAASVLPGTAESAAEHEAIERALEDREKGHPEASERALVAWLCPAAGYPPAEGALRACAPATTAGTGTGWALLGEIAFEAGAADGAAGSRTLARGEVAYGKALGARPSRLPVEVVLYKRAFTRYRMAHYDDALTDFLTVVASAGTGGARVRGDTSLGPEALEYAAICIAEEDWDDDGRPDVQRGFERPSVKARLAAGAPWVADLMVRVTESLIDEVSPDARPALQATAARFPDDPRLADLRKRAARLAP